MENSLSSGLVSLKVWYFTGTGCNQRLAVVVWTGLFYLYGSFLSVCKCAKLGLVSPGKAFLAAFSPTNQTAT